MAGYPEQLAVLTVLLPLLAAAGTLALARWLGREVRWLTAGAALLALMFGVLLLRGTGDDAIRGPFDVLGTTPHALASGVEDLLARYDDDGDGALTRDELEATQPLLTSVDLDRDGVVSADELRAGAGSIQTRSWIGVGELALDQGRDAGDLRLGPTLWFGTGDGLVLVLLTFLGAGLGLHLLGGGVVGDDTASTLPRAAIAFASGSLFGAAIFARSPEFGLIALQLGALGAYAVQHGDRPERVGAGTHLLLGLALALGWAGVGLSWEGGSAPRTLEGAGACLYAAGIVLLAAVLPRVHGSDRTWAAASAQQLMVSLAGLWLIANGGLSGGAQALLALVAVALMFVGLARLLVATQLNDALGWSALSVFGISLGAILLDPSAIAFAGALHVALAALVLAADGAKTGSWALSDLAGLRQRDPAMCLLLLLAATCLVAPTAVGRSLEPLVRGLGEVWPLAVSCLLALVGLGALLLRLALRLAHDPSAAESPARSLRLPFGAGLLILGSLFGSMGQGERLSGEGLASVVVFALAVGLAFALRRLDTSRVPHLGDVEVRYASFAPQRRIVQPILLAATRWEERTSRWERAPLALAEWFAARPEPARRPAPQALRYGALIDSALFAALLVAIALVAGMS